MKQFGILREFPRTGKRGRPKKPKIVPSDDLRYAQVVKTRKNGVLKKVEKKIIFGEEIEQSEISTTLLERQNLTFRQDNNRVSRKTIGFSKVKEWLENQMKLYCTSLSADVCKFSQFLLISFLSISYLIISICNS